MLSISAKCSIQGENFSPKSLINSFGDKIKIINASERDEIGKLGKFKGIPIPYGSADIAVVNEDTQEEFGTFSSLLSFLKESIEMIRELGAEDILLHMDVSYDNQCNLEFEPEDINMMSLIGVPFTLTVYKV